MATEADLTEQDIEFIKELREARENGVVNRRQALGLLAGIGIGGAGGYAAVGGASADPSTSDSDGNVGTPSDPVDVFAEGLGGPTGDVIDVGSNLDLKSSQEIQNASSIITDEIDGGVTTTAINNFEGTNLSVDANGDLNAGGSPLASAIQTGTVYADDGNTYSSIVTAESNATDFMLAGPGTFNEELEITTADLTLVGCGKATLVNGGTTTKNGSIRVSANGVTVRQIAAASTAGGGGNVDAFIITAANDVSLLDIWVPQSDRNGVAFNGGGQDDCRCVGVWTDTANIDSDPVFLNDNTTGSVVDDVIGSVKDNGTGNTVGETA